MQRQLHVRIFAMVGPATCVPAQERECISTLASRCLYVVASIWIAFIAFCRMYLGMHTVSMPLCLLLS